MSHHERLTVDEVDPDAYRAILAMERYVRAGTVEPAVAALVKLRASQLNGCAYCLDMDAARTRSSGC
jgi:AhpD family alkylhydroperoxidase